MRLTPITTPPDGLGPRGAAYRAKIHEDYELSDSEDELLLEAARTLDNLDALAAALERDGATTTGSMGQTVVHPALTEARGQRLVLHRLIAALDLDAEDIPSAIQLRAVAGGRANAQRWKGHH